MTISGKTRVFAILGDPVDHSLSPAMHNAAYAALGMDAVFVALPTQDGAQAVRAAQALGLQGLAVTAPLKLEAQGACDDVEPLAKTIGAVNTVRLGARVEGFNTDVDGIVGALAQADRTMAGASVLVVGAGGTARAVLGAAAREKSADLVVAARDADKAAAALEPVARALNLPLQVVTLNGEDFERIGRRADIVVCTVPADPDDPKPPFDPALLHAGQTVLDAVYHPGGTPLLIAAKKAGCRTVGGDRMLLDQALRQFALLTGSEPPAQIMEQALADALKESAS